MMSAEHLASVAVDPAAIELVDTEPIDLTEILPQMAEAPDA